MNLEQLRRVDVSVALRRTQPRMSEQLLNRAKVRSPLQQVRRERMTEGVWTDAGARASGRVPANESIDAPGRQPSASIVDEQGLTSIR